MRKREAKIILPTSCFREWQRGTIPALHTRGDEGSMAA